MSLLSGCEIDDLAQASDVGEAAIGRELEVLMDKVVEHEAGVATVCSKMFSEKSSARGGARSVARSTARELVDEHD
jgi:hypothetical protein